MRFSVNARQFPLIFMSRDAALASAGRNQIWCKIITFGWDFVVKLAVPLDDRLKILKLTLKGFTFVFLIWVVRVCFHTNIWPRSKEQCNYPSSVQDPQQSLGSDPTQDTHGELSPLPEQVGESCRCFELSHSYGPNSWSHRASVPSFEQRHHMEQDLQEMLRDHRGSNSGHECLFPDHSSIPPVAERSLHSPRHTPVMGILCSPAVPEQQQVFWPATSCHSTYLGNVGGSKRHTGGVWFETSHPSTRSLT